MRAIVATILMLGLTISAPASTYKENLNHQLSGWCPWSSWECNKVFCFNARRRRCLCAKLYTLPNVSSFDSHAFLKKSGRTCHADSQALELSATRCNPISLCYPDTIAWHPSLPDWCPWSSWSAWSYHLNAAGCRSKERRRKRHCGCPQSSSVTKSCTGQATAVERWHQEHDDSKRQAFCRPGPARWCSWQPAVCPTSVSSMTSCGSKYMRRHRLCECPPPQSNEDVCQGNGTELVNCSLTPQICQDLSMAGDLKVSNDVEVAYPFGLKMFFVLCTLLLFLTVLLILRHRRRMLEHRVAARHAQMIMRLETCVRPNEITCRLTSPDFDSQHYLSEAPPRYDEVVHEMCHLSRTPSYQFVENDSASAPTSAALITITDGSMSLDEPSQSLL